MKSPDSDSRPDPARVEELFHAASEVAADEQVPFLVHACGDDQRLLDSVRSLLAAAGQNSTTWDRTALELEARHSAIDSQPALPGQFFGPYRILRRVAAGGMSMVYEALRDDEEFHKRVAIKFVHSGIDDRGVGERFRSERQILAQLEHPNIARLLDGGTTADDIPYLVMEYVDGVPIDHFVADHRLPRLERLHLFLQVCDAVQYAHRNLVVHRDLKPGNILVTSAGMAKLLDFGIAKLITSEGAGHATTVRAMTPEYASPEQVTGRSITTATDVYSLGVVLFVLLADRLPHGGDAAQPAGLMLAICQDEPVWEPRGLIEGDLQSILSQALRKEPERRYLSVEQFAADLRRYLAGMPVAARPDTLRYRARKFAVRRAIPLAAVTALFLAILIGLTTSVWEARRAQRRFDDVRSLAHSLLFDVYDSISGLPGSLPARRLLASRAQRYLDSLQREGGNDSELTRELAESYLRLGDVLGSPYTANLGDTSGALESYQKARVLIEGERLRHANDTRVRELFYVVNIDLGRVWIRQGNAQSAIEALKRSIATVEPLCANDPRNFACRDRLSGAYSHMGEAQDLLASQSGSLADYQKALATSRKALEVLEAAGPRVEDAWQAGIAARNARVAYALWAVGDFTGDASYYQEALDCLLKAQAFNQRRAATLSNGEYRRALADGLTSVGYSRWKCCRDLAGARRDFDVALDGFERLAQEDPNNLEARRDLANGWYGLGRVLAEAGRRTEALQTNRKALVVLEELSRADPSSNENAILLAEVRSRVSALEHGQ